MIDPEERAFEAIRQGVQGQADRIAALEAALEWALGRIQEPTLIRGQNDAHCAAYARARAALAPAPAPAVANPVAWHIERDTERENLLTDHQEVAAIYEMDGYKVTPLYALAPAPAPEGE